MTLRFLVFLLILVATGCSVVFPDRPPVPDDVFTSALIDLHIAAARSERGLGLPLPVDSILARHGMDTTVYRAAAAYYAEHPDRLVAIYTAALDSMESLTGRRPPEASSLDGFSGGRPLQPDN